MTERELRGLIESVRRGTVTRREFIGILLGLGIAAPFAGQLLLHSGIAQAQPASTYKGTKRGGGGPLKVLWWQGATLLNPHFATGTKDQDGSRIFYEPLAGWDGDGNLIPILAAEIPTPANGGVSNMPVVSSLSSLVAGSMIRSSFELRSNAIHFPSGE